MPTQRVNTTEAIARMDAVAKAALTTNKGIKCSFKTRGEALNFRQRFYNARTASFRRDPNSDLALHKVEIALEESAEGFELCFRPQNSIVSDMVFIDAETNAVVDVSAVSNEDDFEVWSAIYAELNARLGPVDISDAEATALRSQEVDRLFASGYRVTK